MFGRMILASGVLAAMTVGAAQAGTVTYDGADQDGRAGGITLTTDGPYWREVGPLQYESTDTISLDVAVGGERYALDTIITQSFFLWFVTGTTSTPYAVAFTAPNAVTFTASDVSALGPRDLVGITLRFAADYQGGQDLRAALAYLTAVPLIAFEAWTADERFLVDLTAEPVAVPAPGALALMASALGAVAARRLAPRA